jgi:hypothetical protein
MGQVTLLEAIAGGDPDELADLLADDVVFHSPVQTYRGRDQVVLLLSTIGGIIEAVEPTREVDTITLFAAEVGEHPVDGMLDQHHDAAGHVAEITLMLRPLAQLQAAVARMARALAEEGRHR